MDKPNVVLDGAPAGIEIYRNDNDNVTCDSGPEVSVGLSMGTFGNTTGNKERQDVRQSATFRRLKQRKGIQIEAREAVSSVKIKTSSQAFLCVENEKIVARRDANDNFELHKCIAIYESKTANDNNGSKTAICCMIKWNDHLLQVVDVSDKVQLQLTKISIDDVKEAETGVFSSFVFKRKNADDLTLSQSFESLLYRNYFLSCSPANNLVVSNCNPKRAQTMIMERSLSIEKVPMISGTFEWIGVDKFDGGINYDNDDTPDDDTDDSSDDE